MSDLCNNPACQHQFPHRHYETTNSFGQPVQVIESIAPPSDGKVIRDSETGEIIFEAPKDRMRVVISGDHTPSSSRAE
jgi:hypothetical protein